MLETLEPEGHHDTTAAATVIPEALFESILQTLTGGRSVEQVLADMKAGKYPFAVSEEQMRADIEAIAAEANDSL